MKNKHITLQGKSMYMYLWSEIVYRQKEKNEMLSGRVDRKENTNLKNK